MSEVLNGYQEALRDDKESLGIYQKCMKKFDAAFCEAMVEGTDFTLRLEIHGCKGRVLHCRVYNDGFERPSQGGQKRT